MALDFRVVNVQFDPATSGPRSQTVTAVFGSRVARANAAVKGFDIQFTNGDHHFLREEVRLGNTAIQNNAVQVPVTIALRDNSGTFDDPYSGSIDVLVIADVA